MLKKIGLGLAAFVLLFVVVVATRPSEFRYQRSTTIAAPPDAVHAAINDFHQWAKWSPWDKLDPTMQRTYDGNAGPGAMYAWKGNKDVGEGRMTIEESKPGSLVKIKLEFIKPFEATNTTTFDLVPEGAGTKVTWTMTGHNNFMSKAFCLFMDMDKLIGSDFDKGLADLKKLVEANAAKKPAATEPAVDKK
ncbi:Hypothetical protein A7982_01515 [Minicystis rosea]|nr:Hypothetical protein A7982_01515 [Minicystis rosea]